VSKSITRQTNNDNGKGHLSELPTPWPSGEGARGAGLDPALVLRTLGMLPMLRATDTPPVSTSSPSISCSHQRAANQLKIEVQHGGLANSCWHSRMLEICAHRPVVAVGHGLSHVLTSATSGSCFACYDPRYLPSSKCSSMSHTSLLLKVGMARHKGHNGNTLHLRRLLCRGGLMTDSRRRLVSFGDSGLADDADPLRSGPPPAELDPLRVKFLGYQKLLKSDIL